MNIRRALLVGAVVAVSAFASVGPVAAKDGDVIVRGTCSLGHQYKLKLSPEDGAIETSFEVDQNRNGQTWSWSIADNGTVVFAGTAVTMAPSGSFEVHRVLSNQSGIDDIVARASNPLTGETCVATATATF